MSFDQERSCNLFSPRTKVQQGCSLSKIFNHARNHHLMFGRFRKTRTQKVLIDMGILDKNGDMSLGLGEGIKELWNKAGNAENTIRPR